jgi:hypothetical protein
MLKVVQVVQMESELTEGPGHLFLRPRQVRHAGENGVVEAIDEVQAVSMGQR